MNWPQAIDNNREKLLIIVMALVASLGLSEGGVLKTLPKFLYRRAMRIIVPAESAVRRLIVMALYEMQLRGVKLGGLPRVRTSFTNFMLLNPSQADHVPAFNLIDPRKIFGLEAPDYASFGASYDDGEDYFLHDDGEDYVPPDKTPMPAASLGRRLLALKNALENLPKQAKRLARWYAHRDAAYNQNQPHLYSPMRPGLPLGYKKRKREEIDEVMLDCHSLAMIARDRSDSS
jgi:hypothetical protein